MESWLEGSRPMENRCWSSGNVESFKGPAMPTSLGAINPVVTLSSGGGRSAGDAHRVLHYNWLSAVPVPLMWLLPDDPEKPTAANLHLTRTEPEEPDNLQFDVARTPPYD